MGFEITTVIAQVCVVLTLIVVIASINLGELNSLIDGMTIETPEMAKLMVNFLVLVLVLSVFLVPSVQANVSKIINKPLEYSIKMLDKFMK